MERKLHDGTLLIVSHGNDLEYLNIILNIYESKKLKYTEVKFLDLSLILKDQDTFHRPLLRLANLISPEQSVFNHLDSLGHNVYRVVARKEFESTDKMPVLALEGIEESIRSALISRSGDENPKASKWLNAKYDKYKREAIMSFNSVKEYLDKNPQISEVAVVNGRFPCQRGVIEAATSATIPWSSYERGTYEMKLQPYLYNYERYLCAVNYWYAPFTTWDRVEKQKAILATELPAERVNSKDVQDWFLQRRQAGGGNRFAENWKGASRIDSSKKLVVIFTSSVDEFAELGLSWKEADWNDQWAAFECLIPLLFRQDYRVVLRVHPNLANKPSKTRRTTRDAIETLTLKFPDLEVIPSTASTNSYTLLEMSDLAIVWISTIGLEATQMGIRTICLSSTEYDLVADVKRWLNKDDVDFDSLEDWNVDTVSSMKFIAGLFALDHSARKLLPNYGVNPEDFGEGIALFSNKWAMRNTNKITNLFSILLPPEVFLYLRKSYRQIKFRKFSKAKF